MDVKKAEMGVNKDGSIKQSLHPSSSWIAPENLINLEIKCSEINNAFFVCVSLFDKQKSKQQ